MINRLGMVGVASAVAVAGYSLYSILKTNPSQKPLGPMPVEEFFAKNDPPESYDKIEKEMEEFVRKNKSSGRRIVCVTGGGTTVPLERNTVRFIDNFSTGRRAAISVEYFLQKGYGVLYLRRRGSVDAFSRHLQDDLKTKNFDSSFLKAFTLDSKESKASISISNKTAIALKAFAKANKTGMLKSVEFESCNDYFFLLRAASQAMQIAQKQSMMYFAAAVSDFFMEDQPTHKIQSSDGPLTLVLRQTPKLLGVLRRLWAPDVMCVSFKLETDVNILIKKAKRAIHKYGVDAVVANELKSRYTTVKIVTLTDIKEISISDRGSEEIEEKIIDFLHNLHGSFIRKPA
ncbi:hypothetical protein AAMO2058_000571400 [Amorphochlora amoebiformis]